MKERNLALAALAAVAILVDCGGGGGGGSAVAPTGSTGGSVSTPSTLVAPAGTLKATMKITIPHATTSSSSSRKVKMIPSNTQSIVFTLVQTTGTGLAPGTVQGPFGLTATSPGCSADTLGNVTCQVPINAPVGSNIFTADIYSSTNAAAGTQLGSGAVQFSVAQNAANTTSISLNGPIAQIVLATNCPSTNLSTNFSFFANACIMGDYATFLSDTSSTARKPATLASVVPFLSSVRVYVIATDTSGNLIVNPTVYDQPVTLELVGQPLLSLGVNYAGVSLPFTSGATTAATTTNGGLIQLWSPLDSVSVSIVPNQSGFVEGYVFGGIGTAQPVASPYPFSTPATGSVPYLLVGGAVPTPSPTPTTAPTPGPLVWTNDQGNPTEANGGPAFAAINSTANPTEFRAEFSAPQPLPSTPANYTFGLASNTSTALTYSFADGGPFGSCLGTSMISGLPNGTPSSGTANVSVPIAIGLMATAPGTCSITATDGAGHTAYLDLVIDQTSFTIQSHKRVSR